MSILTDLAAGYAELKSGTLWSSTGKCKGYVAANPGEASLIDAYVAALVAGQSPAPPTLASATGKGIVEIIQGGYTPAVTPPPPPPPVTNPSGIAMPVGDLTGWKQIFADDFLVDLALGSWKSDTSWPNAGPVAPGVLWSAYPYPWNGTPTTGRYWPEKTQSIHDSVLDCFIHTDAATGLHCVSAPTPFLGPNGAMFGATSLRCDMMWKTDPFGDSGYKASWLLWPDDNIWPADGEIDFMEANFGELIASYMHLEGATSGSQQDVYQGNIVEAGAWHRSTFEWLAGVRYTEWVDGVMVMNETAQVPSKPMHLVLQNGVRFDESPPAAATQGHVMWDWFAAWTVAA